MTLRQWAETLTDIWGRRLDERDDAPRCPQCGAIEWYQHSPKDGPVCICGLYLLAYLERTDEIETM